MPTAVFVDVEGAVRDWVRTSPWLTPLLGSGASARVFFGVPSGVDWKDPTAFPLLTLYRSGGAAKEGDTPLDVARITFDCWGSTKAQAASLAYTVVNAVEAIKAAMPMGAGAVCMGAETRLVLWLPDPATGAKRYVVDADLTVRAAL